MDVFTAVGVTAIMIASGLIGYWVVPGQSDDGACDDGYHQVSTYARLNAGGYDGMISIERMLEHGDFGIGTVEWIDGEMMILDGVAYRAGTDLVPIEMTPGTTTSFAMLTHFDPDFEY